MSDPDLIALVPFDPGGEVLVPARDVLPLLERIAELEARLARTAEIARQVAAIVKQ